MSSDHKNPRPSLRASPDARARFHAIVNCALDSRAPISRVQRPMTQPSSSTLQDPARLAALHGYEILDTPPGAGLRRRGGAGPRRSRGAFGAGRPGRGRSGMVQGAGRVRSLRDAHRVVGLRPRPRRARPARDPGPGRRRSDPEQSPCHRRPAPPVLRGDAARDDLGRGARKLVRPRWRAAAEGHDVRPGSVAPGAGATDYGADRDAGRGGESRRGDEAGAAIRRRPPRLGARERTNGRGGVRRTRPTGPRPPRRPGGSARSRSTSCDAPGKRAASTV